MNKGEFDIENMTLEDDKKFEKLDMELGGPDPEDIGNRIKKLFPDMDLIDLIDDLKIIKMASGEYTINNVPLREIASWDLEKVDSFLKSKGG